VPRAGRLDVHVGGVVDARAWPWNRSALPVDPIVELYDTAGVRLVRVDAEWESGTELASVTVPGPARILVRIASFYPNGNRAAYRITPTYVDTVPPVGTVLQPAAGATGVSRFADVRVGFSEAVANVTSATLLLRDTVTNGLVPATVTYDAAGRQGRLLPNSRLEASRVYRVEVTSGIKDAGNNPAVASSQSFTTGLTGFADTAGNPFAADIDWLALEGITTGCTADRFCPKDVVSREQMASFLVRALALPATTTDHFRDDESSGHEDAINRLASAGITNGCGPTRYCPLGTVTREQMASFLVRALGLAPSANDAFTDDEDSPHEADINALAAAGITTGCGVGTYCPRQPVLREQMAAFLHRAFGD
jgi:Bacterial Ig-like domain/S-layer homology domain